MTAPAEFHYHGGRPWCPSLGENYQFNPRSEDLIMTKINVVCPKCQTKYRFDESHEGRKGRCRKCGQVFVATRQAGDASAASPKPSPTDPGPKPLEREFGDGGVPKVWQPGDVILDLYEITDVLGEGGMGTVFKAHHKGWNRDLAVKSPKPEIFTTKDGMDNFVREAETWIDLGLHPHTVSCFYVRMLGGIPRVFAEYVEGGSLKDWIDDGRLYDGGPDKALERILDIAIQFAWGLHFAHEKGLVHQDVKPANLMMTPDGTAKVTDFGLAKARATAGEATQDQQQSILVSSSGMTPAYCSPEQANQASLSLKTDIWSWAVSVFEMFTGEVTWPSGTVAGEALRAYLEMDEPGDGRLPVFSPPAADLLHMCLQQETNDRPQDMAAVANALCIAYREVVGSEYPREPPSAAEALAATLNNRAVSLMDLGKVEEAERVWEQALEADSHHPESTYNLGLVRWRARRISDQEMTRQLEEVRASHSDQWLDEYLLARTHLERGDCQSAIALLEELEYPERQKPEVAALMDLARSHLEPEGCCVRTFQGHSDRVQSACLGMDDRYALSASSDKTLKLWEVSSGHCLRTFTGHSGPVTAVCLSNDGCHALSGSADETLKLWEVCSGRCVRTFEGHSGRVTAVCFGSEGEHVLSGSGDHTLKLWEVSSGHCTHTFEGHSQEVASVCLSGDGAYILSGSHDQTLRLWDMSMRRCLQTLKGHSNWVTSVCLSADGRYALSASADKTLRLWELPSGRCLRTLDAGGTGVVSASLSEDGGYALSGNQDNAVRLWKVDSGFCLGTFEGHSDWVTVVCLSSALRYTLSGSWDNTLKLWQTPAGVEDLRMPLELSVVNKSTEALAASTKYLQYLKQSDEALSRQDYRQCAENLRRARSQSGYHRHPKAISRWGSLYRYLPRCGFAAGWEVANLEGHSQEVTSACLSMDNRYALSSSKDGTLKLWDVPSGHCLRTFEVHSRGVPAACLSGDARHALSTCPDNLLQLWDVSNGRCLQTFEGHSGIAFSVCLSSDGRYALSGGYDRTLKLWEVSSGHCLRTFEGHSAPVTSACLSPDGRYALSGSLDNTLKLWEVSKGHCLRTLEADSSSNALCLSSDGRYVLSRGTLWELSTGQHVQRLQSRPGAFSAQRLQRSHSSTVSVCLCTDNRYALLGQSNGTLQLWEIPNGQCLRTFKGHSKAVTSIIVSGDGQFALSGSRDAMLKLWFFDWDLGDRDLTDWDEGARPWLDSFLTLRSEGKGRVFRTWSTPEWTQNDFEQLLHTLQCAGYGYLRPEGVRRKLEEMAAEWKGPPPLPDSK